MRRNLIDSLEVLEHQARQFGHTKRANRLRSDIEVLKRLKAEADAVADFKQQAKLRA